MLLCRLCAPSCSATTWPACRSLASVRWYAATKACRKISSDRNSKGPCKSRDEKKAGTSPKRAKRAPGASGVTPKSNHRHDAVAAPVVEEQQQQQRQRQLLETNVDAGPPPPPPPPSCSSSKSWAPMLSDYEALVENLLLYRCESLEAVLSALRKERALFDESVKKMEERIAEMHLVREEIREMLQESASMQRRTVVEAVRAIGGCGAEVMGEGSASLSGDLGNMASMAMNGGEEEEKEEEKEIML